MPTIYTVLNTLLMQTRSRFYQLPSFTLVTRFSMAPLSGLAGPSFIHSGSTSVISTRAFKFILFIVFLATAARVCSTISTRRQRRIMSNPTASQEKESESRKSSPERTDSCLSDGPNQRLNAIKEELSQLSLKPVYPWIAPPTPLPGPYDAPYYQLPSMRTLSRDISIDSPEKLQNISYTRYILSNSVPEQETTISGTTTISNHGWRRTQWSVSSG
jgi:hypothetical protein